MRKNLFLLLTLLLSLILVACGHEEKDKKEITVATSPGPYSELFLKGIKPELEKKGYTVKNKDFTELLQADVALQEGSVDVNVDQHKAYMDTFNQERDANLTNITKIPTVPTQIFSKRHTSLEEIKEGDTIAIPQDPSNASRAFRLLEKAGWIEIDAKKNDITITKKDIIKNPKHLNIKEMNSASIPRVLDDVDYGVIPGSIVYASHLDASKGLLKEDLINDLYLQVVVNEKNKDQQWVKDIEKAYHSKEFKKVLAKENKDGYWIVPEK
ncbi:MULTISPECIES: MetQ/NlpA family ABC transporter substrate-binding protein [Staphylococcus]|uniref:Metal ABC transporter substrate-binding protein n=1 Tax=Staphylococcus schleiferi TaxID=1295 RepID=A0A7Z7QNN3_STASC|nr:MULTISPECIES: MetQ/NlpA family ABC transporter substrate-binding protein [Staphylococcus]QGS45861.1 metal ABC transporter substrate-binding protein [Mammaliicoccus fleurettii]EPD50465.1 YaeC family lipoprotein [Staphylococcus sp. HGB0015]NHA33189.1 metal ABC transporter substrate-binding protein [Staphylococcus schleiferi]NHA37571.1 metal ABC transporter substrate-binding protein [Staphylococcus schleiferi]NHA40164.1 metal ABC transporter substrate-binding protein [Staphylococcus schleiferi